ncbi:hypothetical protein [Geminocystis sp. NIES-3709]|uniref:hypothetical protein n=1 Tax=Geminocystis sp. NIES-3709 TaxID=1617448 RepID=UPI0005FC532F|nr:hypothetical protein [Geminocystis sp. NIES-3709]BAQ65564.1 hypothetical protein GM3709_2329 [Geminocystis sp. NIES-3709]
MSEFLATIEIVSRYEVLVNAPDDRTLFAWNEGGELPEATKLKLNQVQWIGNLVSETKKVIEVIEGE